MLTYCTNTHPGESWTETFGNLEKYIPVIKKAVSPDKPFPLGLRLSAGAVRSITDTDLRRFGDWCTSNQCFVPTINCFPYGSFHGTPVKENVYMPDWRSPLRVDFTRKCAELLHHLLPEGMTGSLSTLPLGYRAAIQKDDIPLMLKNISHLQTDLDKMRQKSGKTIILAFEPEPGCVLETTDDVVHYFEMFADNHLQTDLLGICYDCCHQAVMFEEPDSFHKITRAGIAVPKIHVSSGLRILEDIHEVASEFVEPVYLHQVSVRKNSGDIRTFRDLPDALAQSRCETGDEWRIHFHLPLFFDGTGKLFSTNTFAGAIIAATAGETLLEVETYTWSVLPQHLRLNTIEESIIRELHWVKKYRKDA